MQTSKENNGSNGAYLPSPPNSTRFAPERTTQAHPPFLSLGPVATAALVGPPPVAPRLHFRCGLELEPHRHEHQRTHTGGRDRRPRSCSRSPPPPPFRAVRSASFSLRCICLVRRRAAHAHTAALNSGSGPGAARAGGKWPLSDPSGFSLQGGSAAQDIRAVEVEAGVRKLRRRCRRPARC